MKNCVKLINIVTALAIFVVNLSSVAQAQIVSPMGTNNGREYFVGMTLGQPLYTVNLVNGVAAPGVYHIPASTNMAELFSYAGGVLIDSDLKNVVVRSMTRNGQYTVKSYDFANAFAKENEALPKLNDKDIIHIEQNHGLDKTVKWMSIAAMAASIVSAIVIVQTRD